jgi:hypothetical protein
MPKFPSPDGRGVFTGMIFDAPGPSELIMDEYVYFLYI